MKNFRAAEQLQKRKKKKKKTERKNSFFFLFFLQPPSQFQTLKLFPHPQLPSAFGFWKENPPPMSASL